MMRTLAGDVAFRSAVAVLYGATMFAYIRLADGVLGSPVVLLIALVLFGSAGIVHCFMLRTYRRSSSPPRRQ